MKLIAYTAQDGTCSILIPNYKHRNKILVSEAVTRQETYTELLMRIGLSFDASATEDELAGMLAELAHPYKLKTIEVEPAVYRDETDDEILARVMEKDLPSDALHPTIIEDTQLPYSGYRPETGTRTVAMRNSWVNPPDTISPPVVDMVKARQAKMDLEWRPRRNRLLAELDIEYQKADERADNQRKTAIAAQKTRLRDMPQDFAEAVDAITDPIELDNFDPIADIITNSTI